MCAHLQWVAIYFWLCWSSLLWGPFCSYGEQGLLLVVVCRLLLAVASLVAEHRPQDVWASAVAAPSL